MNISICRRCKSAHMGKHRLAIFGAKSCGKTEISLSAFLHCWVWTNEMTTAARVTQWRTAYSATSSVARPQGLGSDLFPELHFSLSLALSPFPSYLSVSLSPSSPFCSYLESSVIESLLFRKLPPASVQVETSSAEPIAPVLLNRRLVHCFCLYFVYCRLSLGVEDIVWMESFLQIHQLHQRLLVITGASWEQLGGDNDWLEQ